MESADPLLVETSKGLSIYYKKRNLYSKYNPINSCDRYLNNITWKENTIYFIPSPLLGYGLDIILNRIPKSSTLIKVEIDPLLYKISNNRDSLNLVIKGFHFIETLDNIDFSKYKRCELLKLNGGYTIYKDKYDKLFHILLNNHHNYWKNRLTSTKLGQLWISNTLKNLKELHRAKPISMLKTNKPVIVVGAGESVEEILDLIKKHNKKLFILCVDTALQILLEVGIVPDAVLALETQFYNLPDFYGAKDLQLDLIYDISSYPGVLKNLKGNRYYTATKFSNSELLKKLLDEKVINEFLPALGSVGITAIYIALQITNNNIFMAGLDFLYTLGKTHSKGSPYHLSSIINWGKLNPGDSFGSCLKRPLTKRKDKNGNIITSDNILYEYSLHTKELLSGEKNIYDITNRGMDLGVPRIDHKHFLQLIDYEQADTAFQSIENPGNGLNFFNREMESLKETISALDCYIRNSGDIAYLKKKLDQTKYYFEHLPENNPLEDLNIIRIKRLYYTLLRFKRVLLN